MGLIKCKCGCGRVKQEVDCNGRRSPYIRGHHPRHKNKYEDVWSKIDIKNEKECWIWKGAIHHDGYGVFQVNKKQLRAHRVVFILTHGTEIVGDKIVCHHCDNTLCCNPNHLFIGTHKDNIRDMIQKGRANYVRGEKLHHNKLTSAQVDEIRRRYKEEPISQVKLAQEYGVSRAAITCVVNNKTWMHLKPFEGRAKYQQNKLTQEQADEIRKIYKEGTTSQEELAQKYTVSRASIGLIVNNITWKTAGERKK